MFSAIVTFVTACNAAAEVSDFLLARRERSGQRYTWWTGPCFCHCVYV
jgi:hypothetical protein